MIGDQTPEQRREPGGGEGGRKKRTASLLQRAERLSPGPKRCSQGVPSTPRPRSNRVLVRKRPDALSPRPRCTAAPDRQPGLPGKPLVSGLEYTILKTNKQTRMPRDSRMPLPTTAGQASEDGEEMTTEDVVRAGMEPRALVTSREVREANTHQFGGDSPALCCGFPRSQRMPPGSLYPRPCPWATLILQTGPPSPSF